MRLLAVALTTLACALASCDDEPRFEEGRLEEPSPSNRQSAALAARRIPLPAASAIRAEESADGKPMLAWMRAHAAPPLLANDAAAVAEAFAAMIPMAPPGYEFWKSIASDGANAARIGELGPAKAACRGCHALYTDRYRREHRSDALKPLAGPVPTP